MDFEERMRIHEKYAYGYRERLKNWNCHKILPDPVPIVGLVVAVLILLKAFL